MNETINKFNELAEKTKSLFPADATRGGDGATYHSVVNEKLEKAIADYTDSMNRGDKFAADRVVPGAFVQALNTLARIAFRKKYQSEIVEIK